ncbi:alpha-lytic protease prodomain-containing protein [Kribbella rubisoli]|uniref:Alpha-lytic protease prodomain-containing protein n=1 Tax=Kribbella rubisoli TaxID=3075929 RepID=A0A4Q7W2Z9_9ACTN|nr:S1 family peptidase [Kribbella rubisoli]RZU03560.1 alpha-lytic protease prodomain-containing protein [Kribbella rubisoli]
MKVLLAAVITAGVLTVPAHAIAAPEPLAVAGQSAAMQRDFGLTDQQLQQRLKAETSAAKLLPAAQKAAGTAFGGAWYDAVTQKLVVGVVGPDRAAAVRATGAAVTAVPVTAKTLDHRKAAVDKLAGRAVPNAVSGWSADPKTGSVVVNVQAGKRSPAVDAFVAKVAKAGAVTVKEVTAQAPRTYAAGTVGGDPYYVDNIRCSIGFSVVGGYVTAGHCGRSGIVRGWDGSDQGWFQGWSFPGNDYAWVSTGYGWWNVGVVLGWGQVSDQLVRGSWEAPIGSSVCRSGSTSHWHCGTILAKNETVNYGNGALFYGATKTNVCAEGGDSGGSFITGDQAQGVTSGGWGNCTSGGETWFQPVNEILQTYGLTLQTA